MYYKLIELLREVPDDWPDAELHYQAADAIEELSVVVRAQKAVLDKFPRWIPVTERLPKEDGLYLVWMLWPCDEFPTWSIINFDSCAGEFGEWEEYYDPNSLGWVGSDFKRIEKVYAWMPLPEPPKEET